MHLLITLQSIPFQEKVKNAPDKGYETGLVIGSYLPFIILIIVAYFLYYKAKKRKNLDNE